MYRRSKWVLQVGVALLCLSSLELGTTTAARAQVNAATTRTNTGFTTAQSRPAQPSTPTATGCPAPALARLSRHRVARGETIATIAQRYNLTPATLVSFNPSLRSGRAPVGAVLQIPPFNGARVEVRRGASWNELARAYGVRADVLYEVNGCPRAVPAVAFVPGASARVAPSGRERVLGQYPLPAIAPITTRFGWRTESGRSVFHSGVDLSATQGTPVLATGAGTVAFAGQQGDYGNLVVINHADGLQTRYAQLATMTVQVGQTVQPGEPVGTVGNTGTTGAPHLHFEVRFNSNVGWVAQDPGEYFREMRGN